MSDQLIENSDEVFNIKTLLKSLRDLIYENQKTDIYFYLFHFVFSILGFALIIMVLFLVYKYFGNYCSQLILKLLNF